MIKLLEEIDAMLAVMEDYAHGKEGTAITKMRGKIQAELRNVDKHKCNHEWKHMGNSEYNCFKCDAWKCD